MLSTEKVLIPRLRDGVYGLLGWENRLLIIERRKGKEICFFDPTIN